MRVFEQLQQRRRQLGKTLQTISDLTAMSVPQVSNVLSGKVDSWLSTVEALADAMDASLVLIPKHLPKLLASCPEKPLGRTTFRDRDGSSAVHMEDACQLLTLMPGQKYAGAKEFRNTQSG